MKKNNTIDTSGTLKGVKIDILSNGNNVQIDMDEKGCKDLIEILQDLLDNPKCLIVELDKETGYGMASGILSENSIGLILSRRDK